ncbi:hypothetical protein Ocin01_07327 [Orchesella cincta]|uniref:Uncharacterized protein n=1 Tax=Orchesella cincta TaxID=48709 RepID=A0A1D2N238_ORCCI|nr:hypothetical protein Ocin01_07327 [Orchesella cincta]
MIIILSSMAFCFWTLLMCGIHFLRVSAMNSGSRPNSTKILLNQPDFQDPPQDDMEQELTKPWASDSFYNCAWFLTAAFLMAAIVQITAAVKLLNATQIGKDARSALGLCRYWRSVCVMFSALLLCDIILSLRGRNFFGISFLVCNLLIRNTQLYIVQHYMNELDVSIRTLPVVHHPNHLISVPVHFHIPVDTENKMCHDAQFNLAAEPKPVDLPPSYDDVTKDPPNMKRFKYLNL